MRIRAFRAWRPAAGLEAAIASPPYDVVDRAEASKFAGDNPKCFLRISRAEIEFPPESDPYAPTVYTRAATNWGSFVDRGWFERDAAEGLFFYRQSIGAHAQTGVVALYHVDDYERGIIKKHEKTRQKPEDDRSRHILATGIQSGPVFLAYRDVEAMGALTAAACAAAPLCDLTAPDGVRHTVWRAPDPQAVVRAFGGVPCAYIADGHHRAAAGRRAARERAAANPGAGPDAEFNWVLAVFFPASTLRILAYNRAVKDLHGLTEAQFMEQVRARFEVTAVSDPVPLQAGEVCMGLRDGWHRLRWPAAAAGADPVAVLDVSVLQDRLLAPVLGIDDPRSNERITFVGGIRGTADLEQRLRDGRAAVVFSAHPVGIGQLMAVADADRIMPPKSTWFEPKLRSGLIVHALD